MPTRSARRLAAFSLAAALLTGCMWVPGYRPGGPQASRDQYTYPSTVDTPTSLQLKNTITNETLWELDIPIGKQCVVWFYDNQKTGDPNNPSVMRWEIMDLGKESGDLANAMPVPAAGIRRVDSFTRESPIGASRPEPISPPTPAALPREPRFGPS